MLPRTHTPSRPSVNQALGALEAMATFARQTGGVVHVVVPRGPDVVSLARCAAEAVGVGVTIDIMAASVRARFDGRRGQL